MLKNYKSFSDDMILRDYLALDRTVLANERTLLAYIRTFIGLLSAGIGFLQFIDTAYATVIGVIFVTLAPFFVILGVFRYVQIKRKLNTIESNANEE